MGMHAGIMLIVWLLPCLVHLWELWRCAWWPRGVSSTEWSHLVQVFCGNAARSIAVWEPPASEMQEKVLLNGHTGWVRALAAEGRWLFR